MDIPCRTLNIDTADFKAAIDKWTTILDRTHSWETPQQVTIGACAASSTGIEHDVIKIGTSGLEDAITKCTSEYSTMRNRNFQAHMSESHVIDNRDSEAQVLIDFLRKLPSLSDLEWQSSTPLAPPLVQFLRDELPSCNLHLKPFYIPYRPDPDYMRSVLSLPSLTTLWLERKQDDAIQDLVQHILRAPGSNLQELRMSWGFWPADIGPPSPIVWDPELVTHDGQRLGKLQHLRLTGDLSAESENLQTWARHTDFGQLRTLSLETPVTRAALQTLIDLPLQSLYSLGLVLDYRDTSNDYNATLQTFICNLPSLLHFRLSGALPPSALKAILHHLNPTLHTLHLIGGLVFDSSTIAAITDRCAHVQDLRIAIRRAWNKPGEALAVLKAIGRLPRLSHLDLTFDASDHSILLYSTDANEPTRERDKLGNRLTPSDPSFSAFDKEAYPIQFGSPKVVRNGHVRDALCNSAIDAELARAVFKTIVSGAQDGKTPALQRLALKAAGAGDFGTSTEDMSITEIAEEIGKEWVVERCGDDDVLEVRRVGGDHVRIRLEDEDEDEDYGPPVLVWGLEPIFRRIWPGDGDWHDEWHAFPLV
jgi:hypothetical protein